jgi:hypothetical protein
MSNPLKIALTNQGEYPASVQEELTQIINAIQAWANSGKIDISSYMSAVQPRCRYFLNASQSIPNNTDTAIIWPGPAQKVDSVTNAVMYDNGVDFGNAFAPSSISDFLTPPIPGMYLVVAGVSFAGAAGGGRQIWLQQRDDLGARFDIAAASQPTAGAGMVTNMQVSAIVNFTSKSTNNPGVRVMVYQNSGGALSAFNGFAGTYVSMIKLS